MGKQQNGKSNLSLVSKFNFQRVAGRVVPSYGRMTYYDMEGGVPKNNTQDLEQPMLMTFKYLPITGSTDDAVVNVLGQATSAFYNYLRRNNVSVTNYSPGDVAKYLLATAGLAVAYEELVRDFKLLFTRRFKNMGLGKLINTALIGSDTITEAGPLQERILKLKERIEQFPTIKLPLFDDWMELSSKVYKDDDIEKAGIIAFKMEKVPYWNVRSSDTFIGAITYETLPQSLISRINKLSEICNAYEYDADILDVGAELAKANGISGYDLSMPDPKGIEPEFKMEMIDACHNATINSVGNFNYANYPKDSVVLGIQDTITGELANTIYKSGNKGLGIFIADSVVKPNVNMEVHEDCIRVNEYDLNNIIFSHVDDPTDKYIYDITRFKCTRRLISASEYSTFTDKNDAQTKLQALGTTLLTEVTLWWFNQTLATIESNTIRNNWTAQMSQADRWLSFAACPCLFRINLDTNRRYQSFNMRIYGDIDNFAVISNDQLIDLQRYRVLAAWKLNNNSVPSKE